MADFMDFNAWRDLAAASEEEVLQRQLSDVESSTRDAQAALLRARHDAGRARQGEIVGDGVATTTMSSVGSYGDYLKAKQRQENAQAMLAARGAGEFGDVRMRVNADGSYRSRGAEQVSGLQAREAKLGAEDAAGLMGANQFAAKRRADEKAAADAKAAQDAHWKDVQARYLQSLLGGAKGRAGAGGAQRDYVGSYNPYADSQWAQSQGAFEAQQARNAGASNDQVHGVWDAYTAKGGRGSTGSAASRDLISRDPYTNMEEAMNPFRKRG